MQARAEQGHAGDSVQRALRSRFPPRLMPGVPPALRAEGTAGMSFAPSVDSLGAERLANHGMELRTPLITAPSGRYQGAPALIPAVGP